MYNSKIWPQDLRKVTDFIVSKTLKLYNQKILYTKGFIFPHGNQTEHFLNLNLLCDTPLKTKAEEQLI